MKKGLLAGLAVTALCGGSAIAADIARPPPPVVYVPPPPVVAYFTWSGCFVGGNGGGVWVNKDWINPVPRALAAGTSFGTHTASGAIGGFQAGCNYQVGGWVFGIQGDYDWTNAKGSNANVPFPILTDETNVRSLASVTSRIGYAWGRFLGYVKGGGAWERDNYTFLLGGRTFATASETRGGWTVGVGGEYAFLDWLTGFVEYDFYGFGTRTNTFVCAIAACGAASFAVDVKENKNLIKAGLNFKFGG